jgi:hypothetical protein
MKIKLFLSFKNIPESINIATLSKDSKIKKSWWFMINGGVKEQVLLPVTDPVENCIDFMRRQLAISQLPYTISQYE